MDRFTDVVQDKNGRVISGASVLVLNEGGLPAEIFETREGTLKDNPFLTDSLGKLTFCAADGLYSVQVTVNESLFATLPDIRLDDPEEGAGSGDFGTVVTDVFSGTGAQTLFTLAAAPKSKETTQVYVDGDYQEKSTYTMIGTALTFAVAPAAGTNNIEVVTITPGTATAAAIEATAPAGQTGTNVQALIDSLAGTFASNAAVLASGSGAASVGLTPTGDVAATNMQAAIAELASEKATSTALSSGLALKVNITDLAAVTGAAGVGVQQTGVGAIPETVESVLRQTFSIKSYGGAVGETKPNNKIALQKMIEAMQLAGGGVGVVNPGINYGFVTSTPTTHPDFTGCTVPMLVIDQGVGDSYFGTSSIDGMQVREFFFTPQLNYPVTFTAGLSAGATSATLTTNWLQATGPWPVTFSNGDVRYVTFTLGATTATWATGLTGTATASATYILYGQHDGNFHYVRSSWAPGFGVSNDSRIGAVGSATRTAADNRRANFAMMNDGLATWQVGQGVKVGHNLTNEELSDFQIIKFAIPGDTLGSYAVMICERKTGNISYGIGSTIPAAHHHFGRVSGSPVLNMMMLDSGTTLSDLILRNSSGVSQDVGIENNAGNLNFRIVSQGVAVSIDKTTRRVTFNKAVKLAKVNLTYSASMTPDADACNTAQIFANNNTAFAINAPSGTIVDGQYLTISISNIAGVALGAVTWNAIYKMSAWTQPAVGQRKQIMFYYDSSTPAWIQVGGASIDVTN